MRERRGGRGKGYHVEAIYANNTLNKISVIYIYGIQLGGSKGVPSGGDMHIPRPIVWVRMYQVGMITTL